MLSLVTLKNLIAGLGREVLGSIRYMGRVFLFFSRGFLLIFQPHFQFDKIRQHIYFIGMKSVFVICLTAGFTGMVLYNVMGVAKASLEATVRYLAYYLGPEGTRVNAISAGPIKTLAAAGIAGFRKILGHVEENAPLRRTVTIEDVGNVAAFLCSDLAAGVTGEITYVDAGYNILGMTGIDSE